MNNEVIVRLIIVFLIVALIWFITGLLFKSYAKEQIFIRDIMEKNKVLLFIYKVDPVKNDKIIKILEGEQEACQTMLNRFDDKLILKIFKPFINDNLSENIKKK